MTQKRSIEKIIPPQETHWVGDGFRVHNFFPYGMAEDRMSPFFLLDYGSKYAFPPSDHVPGVGPHPHRGFETVTFAFKGRVAHHDSRGNSGIIGEGDVQWMTAGKGILHKEYHEAEFAKTGGDFHMVQLWVNLPAKHKMTEPKYQAITADEFAKLVLPDGGGTVDVVAGELHGVKGTATTFSPLHLYVGRLKAGAKLDISTEQGYNTAILNLQGHLTVNGETVPTDNFVLFANDGDGVAIEAADDAMFFFLSGEPLNEPIATYGPFVMNTRAEIQQAMVDFNNGEFGELE